MRSENRSTLQINQGRMNPAPLAMDRAPQLQENVLGSGIWVWGKQPHFRHARGRKRRILASRGEIDV
jgi:hypothetical protein